MDGDGSRPWLAWLERLAALAVVVFLALYLARNWAEVRAHDWSVDGPRLALASGVLALTYSAFVLLWRRVLGLLGARLSVVDAHRIWYLSNLGRYAPGRVLQLAGTAWMARAKGIGAVRAITGSIVAQLFVLGSGLLVAAAALPEAAAATGPWRVAGLVAAAAFVALLLTPAFERLRALAARWAGPDGTGPPIRWPDRLGLTVAYAATWLLLGMAFWLFVSSLTDLGPEALLTVVGIFAAAYVAGFLAVFVPGGLGVREGVLAALLALYIPPSIAVAVAIAARIWSTAVEIAAAGLLVARFGVADLRATPATPPEEHG